MNKKRINSFLEIRWQDPFPDENTSLGQDQDEFILHKDTLVYPEEFFHPKHGPMVITRPTDLVMLKLMRACVGCEEVDDLWIAGQRA